MRRILSLRGMRSVRVFPSVALAALCGALSLPLLAASGDSTAPADSHFAGQAMPLLLQSIANANPAESDGDAGIKALASKVQSDEVDIGTQLVSLASYYGIALSTDAPKPSCDASGYVADQAKTLPLLIALFRAEAQDGGAAQVRSFAIQSIPILEADLRAVQGQSVSQ
jgi:hypothetical protein